MEFRIDKIDGIDEFLRRIGELSVQKVINGSIKKSIFSVENQSKRETPVDTGILRNSYETKFENLEGRLRNFREYGLYVHEWHKQTPWRYVPAIGRRLVKSYIPWNPFMQRALDKTEPKLEQIFRDDIEKFLTDLTK